MRKLLPFVFLLILNPVLGQDLLEIKGRISDSVTGNPLSFAQISVRHTGLGTTTNEEGNFRLDIPDVNRDDTLMIFFLGYQSRKIAVNSFLSGTSVISLKPVMLQLSEVDIVGLTPQEVIRRAVAAIPFNYGKEPLILTAFIRSQKSVNNRLAEYTEAIIEDYKTGYYLYKKGESDKKHKQSNIPLLMKGRVVSDTNLVNAMGDVGRNVGCLGCNFINDIVEFYHHTILDESLFSRYDLSMEEQILPEGGKIYHIRFSQKKDVKERLWKGDLYIDAYSFAVMKILQKPSMYAYEAYEKTKYNRGYTIMNKPGWLEEMPFIQQTITYSKRDTSWVLSSIRTENWMTFTSPANGQRMKFSYKNDVIITHATRNPEQILNFKGDKVMGTSQRWDQIIGRPDETFWAKFNYLPVEEALKAAVEGIGK
ncbi:MAG: carboxypeptidase-like regulatory domain-containing protein [Bacteroidetes bacterium]|nr:carboxypeptidase-like regulatory domain-containing protein [Bacteroidota bacterium]